MESASCELALMPSLYNNRPKHSKYFCAGNTRLPRTSNLAQEAPTSRAPGVSPGENTHIPRTCLARSQHPRQPQGFGSLPTIRPGLRKLPTRQSMSSRWSPYHFILCTQLGQVSLSGYEVQSYFNILKYFDTIITN